MEIAAMYFIDLSLRIEYNIRSIIGIAKVFDLIKLFKEDSR